MARRNLKTSIDTATGFGLNVFTSDDLNALHFSTLDILYNTGVRVESEEALEIFHGGGARVEKFDGYGLVYLPNYLVEDCIRWAPRTIILHGRTPDQDYVAELGRTGFAPSFGECVKIIDPKTRQIRGTTKQDLVNVTRLADAFEEMVVIERAVGSFDQLPETHTLHNYEAMVNNTGKHCFLGMGNGETTKKIIAMAKVASGGVKEFRKRPLVTGFVCPTSPLNLVRSCCESIITCAREGAGIATIPMALVGATGAATLAGTLVAANAEALSTIVLAQLVQKGTPCIYCGCSTIMDMRIGTVSIGAPELGILSAGIAKLAQFYKLPSWVGGGGADSKVPDAQSAYEFSLSAMLAALAGANISFGAGVIESGMTFDYAKFIMDVEQLRRIMIVLKGIEISDMTIDLNIINEVGPGGEFISHHSTLQGMHKLSQARLFDRQTRDVWLSEHDGRDLTDRAYEEALKILDSHKPAPLPDGVADAVREIIEDYEAELKVRNKTTKLS